MADIDVLEGDGAVTVVATVNGQNTFDFDFLAYAGDSVRAVFRTGQIGEAELDFGIDYTVAGLSQEAGGSITLAGAFAGISVAGDKVLIYRSTPIRRLFDYQNAGDFRADTVNRELDTMVMIDQENRRDIDRSLKVGFGSTGGSVFAGSAGTVPMFDASGNLVEGPTADEIDDAQGYAEASALAQQEAEEAADAAFAAQVLAEAAAAAAAAGGLVFDSYAAASAAVIPPAATMFETRGRSAPGDGGATTFLIENVNPAGTAKIALLSGKYGRSLERVLRPEQFGIVAGGMNQQQGFLDLAAELRWRGGGRVEFPDYKNFNVFDALNLAGGAQFLMMLDGTSGTKIRFNGSKILTANPFTNNNDQVILFGSSTGTIDDLEVDDCHFEQTVFTALNQSKGISMTLFGKLVRGIEFSRAKQKGGIRGMCIVKPTDYNEGDRSRFIKYQADCDTVYYPFNCQRAGDHAEVELNSYNGGRAFFVYNVHHHKAKITSRHGGPFTDMVIANWSKVTDSNTTNSTTDIEIDYRTLGRVGGAGQGESVLNLAFFQEDDINNVKFGGMRHIKAYLDVANSPSTPYRSLISTGKYVNPAGGGTGTADTTDRDYTIADWEFGGNVAGFGGIPLVLDMFNNSAYAPGGFVGENIDDIRFVDFATDDASSFAINGAVVRSGLVFENIRAPAATLDLGAGVTSGALQAFENVNFSNLKSSSPLAAQTAGNSSYRRLPDGRVEMSGVVLCNSNSNTVVNLPLTVSLIESVSAQPMSAGNNGVPNISALTTTTFTINTTTAWANGNVFWRAVGRI